ncbi:MAG: hypothetical protein QXE81_02740 [Desulfurococcaceae archaeon]
MKRIRGDISTPVLAIIVTVSIIIAGLTLISWFWIMTQQAGSVGVLQILGTPALFPYEVSEGVSELRLFILVRNIGNEPVRIIRIIVENTNCTVISENVVFPGEPKEIIAICGYTASAVNKKTAKGTLFTDYGTYTFTATIL